jgi:hypothetical protein
MVAVVVVVVRWRVTVILDDAGIVALVMRFCANRKTDV